MPSKKTLLVVLAVLVLLVIAGYVAARMVLGSSIVPEQIEQQLSARFGQPVHIGGATASVFPRVALDLRDVSIGTIPVSYTHLRAHETRHDLVCRLLLE